jgi:hypothetical protein
MASTQVPVQCRRCLQIFETAKSQCPVCKLPDSPPTFVMVYEKGRKGAAIKLFQADAARMAAFGYFSVPSTQRWEKGHGSRGANMAIGMMFGVLGALVSHGLFPPPGRLSVVYRRSDLTEERVLAMGGEGISWTASRD